MEQELFYVMALTRLTNFNYQQALELYKTVGSAQLLYEHRNEIGDIVKEASPTLMQALQNWDDAMKRADFELHYMQEHSIRGLVLGDDDYPQRLCECPDAPLVLYYKGNCDLNQTKIVSIVGTRQMTVYGQDLIRHFVTDLKRHCSNVLIVSGLAYGVDIYAHREALANGYETVGVLAHGLDQIYPYRHHETAAEMVNHGGLLTVGSEFSKGCNNMIRDNVAGLISNANDFVVAMGWQDEALRKQAMADGIERNLFPDLSAEEQKVVSLLQQTNNLQLNILSVKTGIPIGQLTALLFQLEMKGVVKPLAGGTYHLLS